MEDELASLQQALTVAAGEEDSLAIRVLGLHSMFESPAQACRLEEAVQQARALLAVAREERAALDSRIRDLLQRQARGGRQAEAAGLQPPKAAINIASNLPPILGGCPLIGGFGPKSSNLPPICPLFFFNWVNLTKKNLLFCPSGTNLSQGDQAWHCKTVELNTEY